MTKMNQFEVIKPPNLPKIGAQHYTKKDRPLREELVPCKERNVINDPLVERDRILFPQLHIKLGLIKQFTKALGCPRGVMVKAMNCGIVVREFVLQSRYYVHFRANTLGKGMNPLILPPAMGK